MSPVATLISTSRSLLLILLLSTVSEMEGAPALDSLLWKPDNFVVWNDEFVSTVNWGVARDKNVLRVSGLDRVWNANTTVKDLYSIAEGYELVWGVWDNTNKVISSPTTIYVVYPVWQMQPLTAGVKYATQVRVLGQYALTAGPWSDYVFFESNSSRVNYLRQICTGFFDDFNLPAGSLLESKWNTAVSVCNARYPNFAFINKQYHAHSMVSDTECDRGMLVSRPRAVFDITDRVGHINVDIDGAFNSGRDIWYMEIQPFLIDTVGHSTAFEAADMQATPVSSLRVALSENIISLFEVSPDGHTVKVHQVDLFWWNTNNESFPRFDLLPVPNIRQPLEVVIPNNRHVDVYLRGIQVINWTLYYPLQYTKYHVLFNQFSYNTPKGGSPYITSHWDNFCFDGPAPTIVTQNFRNVSDGRNPRYTFTDYRILFWSKLIEIPTVTLSAVKAARVHFVIHCSIYSGDSRRYNFSLFDNHTFWFNGQEIGIPNPTTLPQSQGIQALDYVCSYLNGFSHAIQVPINSLIQGTNNITFKPSAILAYAIGNIHIEIDYPKGQQPPYTEPQECTYPSGMPIDTHCEIPAGPHGVVNNVGSNVIGTYVDHWMGFDNFKLYSVPTSTTLPLTAACEAERTSPVHGVAIPITSVELWINGKMSEVRYYNNTPRLNSLTFNVDTAVLGTGIHEIYFLCNNSWASRSFLNSRSGWSEWPYRPIIVSVGGATIDKWWRYPFSTNSNFSDISISEWGCDATPLPFSQCTPRSSSTYINPGSEPALAPVHTLLTKLSPFEGIDNPEFKGRNTDNPNEWNVSWNSNAGNGIPTNLDSFLTVISLWNLDVWNFSIPVNGFKFTVYTNVTVKKGVQHVIDFKLLYEGQYTIQIITEKFSQTILLTDSNSSAYNNTFTWTPYSGSSGQGTVSANISVSATSGAWISMDRFSVTEDSSVPIVSQTTGGTPPFTSSSSAGDRPYSNVLVYLCLSFCLWFWTNK